MQITLQPAMAKFVEQQIRSGRYGTADEVVNGALSALQSSQEDLFPADLDALRGEIAHGLGQADRGESEDWDVNEIRAEGRRLLAESREDAQKKAG